MGRKKQGNGRDSNSNRLGTKVFGGQTVKPGCIIIRQRGAKFHPGDGTALGRDYTLYSKAQGVVEFSSRKGKKIVNVIPSGAEA